jgi:uncharacterized protein
MNKNIRSISLMLTALFICTGCSQITPGGGGDEAKLLVVDCLVPGQVRKLGAYQSGVTPRRATKTTIADCESKGGEYVSSNTNPAAALNIWLPFAKEGDEEAQTNVGEIYEKGVAGAPDYVAALQWYQKAADKNYTRAQVNLGALYERGLGVKRDSAKAQQLFRMAGGVKTNLDAPTIQIIDPVIVLSSIKTRGAAPVVRVRGTQPTRDLVGKITAPAGLASLLVNDKQESFDDNGLFKAAIDLASGAAMVKIVAIDKQGQRATAELNLVKQEAPLAPEPLLATPLSLKMDSNFPGNYYALVIANQNYRKFEKLDTPINDGRDIKNILETRFGFKVTLLQDATRRDILVALNDLRNRLSAKDNLLVYYAGHGDIDAVNQRGYWIPIDGEQKNVANWISIIDISDQLIAMPAKHVLVIADSCYAGTMTRAALSQPDNELSEDARRAVLTSLGKNKARVALTSGGLEPVVDGGGGKNSMFAKSLLEVLTAVREPIEANKVHAELSARFLYRATRLKVTQRPDYAPIKYAGHEAGDFLFVPIN